MHSNSTHLFVAALLSPQCSDAQVNKTTAVLFKHFGSFDDYANADLRTLRSQLSGVNFYKTKAVRLRAAATMIVKMHDGKIPRTIRELVALPGVGRKVANVILNEAFGINEGIAVDTHVIVTSKRLGLTKSRDPAVIEKDLMKKFPKAEWGRVSNLLIELGRDTCKARLKECHRCSLRRTCPSSDAK